MGSHIFQIYSDYFKEIVTNKWKCTQTLKITTTVHTLIQQISSLFCVNEAPLPVKLVFVLEKKCF